MPALTAAVFLKVLMPAPLGQPSIRALSNLAVLTLAVDPQNPDKLYAGTNGGGVFKSNNGGADWVSINSGLTAPGLTVQSLAIEQGNPNKLYAGTKYGGVYRSSDSGDNWTPADSGINYSPVLAIVIDRTNTAIVYAGASGGVFKSTDGGANWVSINSRLNNLTVLSLAINPVNSNQLFAGTFGSVQKTTDLTAPTITLIGDASLTIGLGVTYLDPGATVSDNVDVGLTASVSGHVDTSTLGTYTLTYSAIDSAGNAAAQMVRSVTVVSAINSGGGALDFTSVLATLFLLVARKTRARELLWVTPLSKRPD